MQAYRECARKHHPDKGGDAEVFARIQVAFVTLYNPQKRAVYDDWAKEVQFRYVPGVTPKVCSDTSHRHVSLRECLHTEASHQAPGMGMHSPMQHPGGSS